MVTCTLELLVDCRLTLVPPWCRYAIMISRVGDFKGTKERIKNSYLIREHFAKACELNPTDATSRHLLGVWCFEICVTFESWALRKVAAAIFATPPESSYEEALRHLQQAEAMEPGFYSQNTLYLAKTLLKLPAGPENKELARGWLQATMATCAAGSDRAAEEACRVEAEALAKKHALVL